ncbi:MAG: YncE family protein [Acetobacteraceae bacterium]|nr:YncE family protein [Acetobacteraceae bacterium]MBV8522044.1 YncE family protein [Acetobacteraceae bacterium]MBV8590340.1 YncE family protein [Acetobacteraceae bacterium]
MQQTTAGAGATTVRVSPDGSLALVCNRTEGTISVFSVKNKRLTASGKLDLGQQSGPSGLIFSHDGKTALVSRNFDHQITALHINGTQIEIDKRPLTAGVAPYTMDITADGKLAAVSNMGRGNGDIDTVSLIDMTADPIRVVETVSVGLSPEGLKLSPDGKFLAVGAQNGTTKPPSSPFFHDHGQLVLFAVSGHSLKKITEVPIGRWSQGIAFTRDGKTILVENMVERNISVFRWDGQHLTEAAPLPMGAGPAAIGTAWP